MSHEIHISAPPLHERIGGKLTFYGVYMTYLDAFRERWDKKSWPEYERNYTQTLAPFFNEKALDEYTLEDIEKIVASIRTIGWYKGGKKNRYKRNTIDKFKSNIRLLFRFAVKNGVCIENPLWGSSFDLPEITEAKSFEAEFVKLRKSLLIAEELRVAEQVLVSPLQDGEKMGVALMFALGLRNSEACATNFEDIRRISGHEDSYCLWIYKTTVKNKSALKAGGKTKNADRLVPIPDNLARFLHERLNYLKKLVADDKLKFEKGDKYTSVEELPIVCVGQNYKERCAARHLTVTGKAVLKEAKLHSGVLGYIDDGIKSDDVLEKEATSYLFRRNFATHLHILGLNDSEIQYVIGHEIEDPTEMRNFFSNPEKLYPIKLKMDNRPLISNCYPFRAPINLDDDTPMVRLNTSEEQRLYIHNNTENHAEVRLFVAATEPKESISAEISVSDDLVSIHATVLKTTASVEHGNVNIIPQYHELYEKTKNALMK